MQPTVWARSAPVLHMRRWSASSQRFWRLHTHSTRNMTGVFAIGRGGTMTEGTQQTTGDNIAVRPFQVGFPEAELTELRRRINATRWPERETVTDDTQGVRLAMMQELARYWGTDYDWGKCEEKLNALPNFTTEIDGL